MSNPDNKDMQEWKLSQLFKLQAELATFGCKCIPNWNTELTPDKVKLTTEENSPDNISHQYADKWIEAWKGCCSIVESATLEDREHCCWLLDKRQKLRSELETYGTKVLPELAAAIGDDTAMLSCVNNHWMSTWELALSLVSGK